MTGFREYIEYSSKLLELANDSKKSKIIDHFLISSTILSWSAIESFVNNMLDDFSSLPKDMFELHERALLLEKRIRFSESGKDAGTFYLEGTEYRRLEDKILFLIAKFSKNENFSIKKDSLWQRLIELKKIRDKLIHPRRNNEMILNYELVESHLITAKETIILLSDKVWRKKVNF